MSVFIQAGCPPVDFERILRYSACRNFLKELSSLNNAAVTTTALEFLKQCKLFVFDLDGTVYEETSHFTVFEQRLADLLPSDKRREFQADVKEIMNRRHILDFGDGYQSETKTIVKGGKYFTWTGAQLTRGSGIDNADQSPAVNFADDPWGVYAIVALHYGLPQDAIQNAFLATRSHMQSDDFGMTPMPGLAATIQQMRSKGIHAVLITNSPEPDSMAILHKLGLSSVFEQKTFNAKKQVNAPSYFQQLQNQYQIPYPQMVSIGDHYRNEIAPAIKLGMQTICIDRYQIIERPDVTVQVRHPNQISSVLKAILE